MPSYISSIIQPRSCALLYFVSEVPFKFRIFMSRLILFICYIYTLSFFIVVTQKGLCYSPLYHFILLTSLWRRLGWENVNAQGHPGSIHGANGGWTCVFQGLFHTLNHCTILFSMKYDRYLQYISKQWQPSKPTDFSEFWMGYLCLELDSQSHQVVVFCLMLLLYGQYLILPSFSLLCVIWRKVLFWSVGPTSKSVTLQP